MNSLFRAKICGVTLPDDAELAITAGADALGLNFYRRSKRFVSRETAVAIRKIVNDRARCVGVFVNASLVELAEIVEGVGLDVVQLHGDEPPDYVAELRAAGGRLATVPLIVAFRHGERTYPQMAEYVEECRRAGSPLSAALIDAHAPGEYGGAGKTIDWDAFRQSRPLFRGLPLILAGGLTARNVATAIAAADPDGVDVASGVELSPGRKDPAQLRLFLENARGAWEKVGK